MAAILVGGVLVVCVPGAGASSLLGPSVEVLAPADAASTAVATLSDVACWSHTDCTAVGSYFDKASNGIPMAASGAATAWTRAVPIVLPKNHATSFSASGLYAVACPSATNCVAVGSYEDTTPALLPIVASASSSKWSPASPIGLPATAGGNQLARLTSISCVAIGSCVAVGSFSDKKSVPRIMEVTETAGSWSIATQLALPSNAGVVQRTLGNVELSGVSCTNASDCVAVGSYLDSAGAVVPMRVTESAGVWGPAVPATMPARTPTVTSAELYAVSCVHVGACVAVGYYTNAASRIAPMVDVEAGGTWRPVVPLGMPPRTPAATGGSLYDVACTTARTCAAVGDLTLASGQTVPDVAVDVAGRWQPLQQVVSIPAGIAHPRTAELHGVSCPAVNVCVGAGSLYAVTSGGAVLNAEAMATRITPVRAVVSPAPPNGVVAAPRTSSIVATWHAGNDGGTPITSYHATASPGTATCTTASTSCAITGLTDGTHYSVTVTATNAHGTSMPSVPSALVVPGRPPSSPSGLGVSLAHQRAAVRWHAATASAGDPVLRYVAAATTSKGPTRTCTSKALSCTLTGLVAKDLYRVTVVARNAVGTSPPSEARTFRAI